MSVVRLEIRRFLTIQRVKFSNAFPNPFVCMEMRKGGGGRKEGRREHKLHGDGDPDERD